MALVIIISAESVDLLASDPAFCKDARMTSKMLKLFKPPFPFIPHFPMVLSQVEEVGERFLQ